MFVCALSVFVCGFNSVPNDPIYRQVISVLARSIRNQKTTRRKLLLESCDEFTNGWMFNT